MTSSLLRSCHKACRMSSTASSNSPNPGELHFTPPNRVFFIILHKIFQVIYNHIRIHMNSKFDPSGRWSNACSKWRQAFFALKTSISKLYKRVIIPSILYGCEVWCDLCAKDIETLNTFHHFIAKHAIGLPCHTRSDMW